jgi:hypothetical protein
MKNDDSKVVDFDLDGSEFDEGDEMFNDHVMVVHSPQELFQLISRLTGGVGLSEEDVGRMMAAAGQGIVPGEEVATNDIGVDVWGPAFRNDPRDVHVYNGQLTSMTRSVFDRIH